MPSSSASRRPPSTASTAAIMTRVARRMWGKVPDNAYVLWHNKPVLKAVFGFEQKVGEVVGARPPPQDLRRDGERRAIGCSWCLDFGYFLAHNEGLTRRRSREVPRWRESDVFTDLERDVMAYAEAMTATPPRSPTRWSPTSTRPSATPRWSS